MYKISTLNKISKVGLSHFDDRYIITGKIEDANGILVKARTCIPWIFLVSSWPSQEPEQGSIIFLSTPVPKKASSCSTPPGANANAVKELVLIQPAGMFLAARHIPRALSWAASLTEVFHFTKNYPRRRTSAAVEKGKSQFAGTEIMGKTLGIAGLGAIGKKGASAAALGMNIVGYDPFSTDWSLRSPFFNGLILSKKCCLCAIM